MNAMIFLEPYIENSMRECLQVQGRKGFHILCAEKKPADLNKHYPTTNYPNKIHTLHLSVQEAMSSRLGFGV